MPTFKGQVSEEEINELIAYLKSLHRARRRTRVEEYPPPVATPPINPQVRAMSTVTQEPRCCRRLRRPGRAARELT